MKPTPEGWPRISSGLYYRDPATMIDWLCRAFGFEPRLRVEDDEGRIVHSELTYGEGLIMVGGERAGAERRFETDIGPFEIRTFRVSRDPDVEVVETNLLERPMVAAEDTTPRRPEGAGQEARTDGSYSPL